MRRLSRRDLVGLMIAQRSPDPDSCVASVGASAATACTGSGPAGSSSSRASASPRQEQATMAARDYMHESPGRSPFTSEGWRSEGEEGLPALPRQKGGLLPEAPVSPDVSRTRLSWSTLSHPPPRRRPQSATWIGRIAEADDDRSNEASQSSTKSFLALAADQPPLDDVKQEPGRRGEYSNWQLWSKPPETIELGEPGAVQESCLQGCRTPNADGCPSGAHVNGEASTGSASALQQTRPGQESLSAAPSSRASSKGLPETPSAPAVQARTVAVYPEDFRRHGLGTRSCVDPQEHVDASWETNNCQLTDPLRVVLASNGNRTQGSATNERMMVDIRDAAPAAPQGTKVPQAAQEASGMSSLRSSEAGSAEDSRACQSASGSAGTSGSGHCHARLDCGSARVSSSGYSRGCGGRPGPVVPRPGLAARASLALHQRPQRSPRDQAYSDGGHQRQSVPCDAVIVSK
eukprot:CAMPEP_0170613476 /NCGR_PEP_ID=MMETSP0224-20130122/24295_1 /TAXON_ID=285029 /ORGANISM="Togula jolla, Strain CCCM 725" /LENGTH=461 /DNA_ID=CAMNT_0010939085 /DNA_START=1 /DNA_END=1386 /DNA_ORIENTATION=-